MIACEQALHFGGYREKKTRVRRRQCGRGGLLSGIVALVASFALTGARVQMMLQGTQNAKTEWSLTGGGRLQESNHRGSLPRRMPGTSILWKIIYCMQFLSYAMGSSMLLLSSSYMSYIPSSIVHIAYVEIRECVKLSLTKA